jgi:hypothetical protein
MSDVLTAYDLNTQMVAKSHEVDDALTEYRDATELWVEADRVSRRARAQAFVTAKGKTVAQNEALVDIATESETYEAEKWKALREVMRESLRAKLSQLSALQSQAGALKEELRLARTDNYQGGP